MAFFSDVVTVGTATAVQIVPPSNVPQHVTIHNEQKQSNSLMFLGGSAGMGTATSAHIGDDEARDLVIPPGDVVFCLASSNDLKISVLRVIY